MKTAFKTIGIIGRLRNPGVKETLQALIDFLLRSKQNIVIEAETAESLQHSDLQVVSRDQLGKTCDLLIVVGGDGSLLNAAHAVVDHEIPVLGINRGSLGFLTDIHPTELERIQTILDGQYNIEKRFLLTASIEQHDKKMSRDDALNEVAFIPDMIPHMIEFEIYINDQFVCSQLSDGLIVATPTGSTAYALSCGGPIIHPQLNAITLVPICAHTLTSRPLVVDGGSTIKIVIPHHNKASPRLSCDGQESIGVPQGSHILISKKKRTLNLIHPLNYHYYETLRSKLHWGKKLHYKE